MIARKTKKTNVWNITFVSQAQSLIVYSSSAHPSRNKHRPHAPSGSLSDIPHLAIFAGLKVLFAMEAAHFNAIETALQSQYTDATALSIG